MGLAFVGGPYDGMEIEYPLLNQHARMVPLTGDLGTRLFVFMPPRTNWDALIRGESVSCEPRTVYERRFAPDGTHFEATSEEAFAEAQVEARLKVHPRARTALAALSQREKRAVLEAVAKLQKTDPSSWPPEEVNRLGSDKSGYLLRATPNLRAYIRTLEAQVIELTDIVSEETLRLFLERYRTGSKVG